MSNVEGLVGLRGQFEEITELHASAPISKQGALESASRIVRLDEQLTLGQVQPTDVYIAATSASQLLNWCEQQRAAVASGDRITTEDPTALANIHRQMAVGGLETEKLKTLVADMYVADPYLGASKSMEIFRKLHERFPDVKFTMPDNFIDLSKIFPLFS